MARPLRIQYPNAWYHVTCRGNARSPIFRGDSDRHKFLELLKESSLNFNVEVHCYCLMKNHFHLLVKTPLANLDRFMHRFNTAYIVFFNWYHKRCGHLYQGRYKAILVEADNYLLELTRYIHLNPVRIKSRNKISSEEKLNFLRTYPWSSYQSYAYSRKNRDPFLHQDTILSMAGGTRSDSKLKKRRYRNFVSSGLENGIQNPLANKKANSILGSEDFIAWVYSSFSHEFRGEKEYSKICELSPSLSIQVIIDTVSSEFKVQAAALRKKYMRTGGGREAAIEFACRYLRGKQSICEIGRQFNLSTAGVILSRARLKNKLTKNSSLRHKFEQIEKKLISKLR
jgi:REP-associated tyrosine transposase